MLNRRLTHLILLASFLLPLSLEAGCVAYVKSLFIPNRYASSAGQTEAWRSEIQRSQREGDIRLGLYSAIRVIQLNRSLRQSFSRNALKGAEYITLTLAYKSALADTMRAERTGFSSTLVNLENKRRRIDQRWRSLAWSVGPSFLFWLPAFFENKVMKVRYLDRVETFTNEFKVWIQTQEAKEALGFSLPKFSEDLSAYAQSLASHSPIEGYLKRRAYFKNRPLVFELLLFALVINPLEAVPTWKILLEEPTLPSVQFIVESAKKDDRLNPVGKKVGFIVDDSVINDAQAGPSPFFDFVLDTNVENSLGEIYTLEALSDSFEKRIVHNPEEFRTAYRELAGEVDVLYILGHGFPGILFVTGQPIQKLVHNIGTKRKENSGTVFISCLFGDCMINDTELKKGLAETSNAIYGDHDGIAVASTSILGLATFPLTNIDPKFDKTGKLAQMAGLKLLQNGIGWNQMGAVRNAFRTGVPPSVYDAQPGLRTYEVRTGESQFTPLVALKSIVNVWDKAIWIRGQNIVQDSSITEEKRADLLDAWLEESLPTFGGRDLLDQRRSTPSHKE